jgi:transcriptional regulator with GAF, ATPase, and Fis domain
LRAISLKKKLILGIFCLVIGSSLAISLLVMKHYSTTLHQTMAAQAENVAHASALEAVDKVLINDMVALQDTLDHQMESTPSVAYLFVYRDGKVIAHTFKTGFPIQLIGANDITPQGSPHLQEIQSTDGKRYVDIAWPIFGGKAGVLRLGISEKPYQEQFRTLWIQMGLMAIGVLLLALTGALAFIRRITRPIEMLSHAALEIQKGELGVRVHPAGKDEIGKLAVAFNNMVESMEEYTGRLEEQTMELEQLHRQTKAFCDIVREIGSFRSLDEVGIFLINEFRTMLDCSDLFLLILNSSTNVLFVLSDKGNTTIEDPQVVPKALSELTRLKEAAVGVKATFCQSLVLNGSNEKSSQCIIPVRDDKKTVGALIVSGTPACHCDKKKMNLVESILSQAAGIIKRAAMQEGELHALRSHVQRTVEFCGIVGKDPKMQVIYKLIEDVAPTDATILVQGESGTGKELVASAIHQKSPRKNEPFVVINCSAYPETLLESELFGHEKGAFTGAIRARAGRFEQANGGTVFLDEIGEISPSAQIKLLRVLQTHSIERLGGDETLQVDVRILAATNRDLLEDVKKGKFREDLYYRLNVIPVRIPALRERPNDIPVLARHFLRLFAHDQKRDLDGLSPEAMRLIMDYTWPGNVRELENSIEHAVVLAKGALVEPYDLPLSILQTSRSKDVNGQGNFLTIEEQEKVLLRRVLEACAWNKKEAALRLGISRSTLYDKLKRYGIKQPTQH